jgi:hypothetical protein
LVRTKSLRNPINSGGNYLIYNRVFFHHSLHQHTHYQCRTPCTEIMENPKSPSSLPIMILLSWKHPSISFPPWPVKPPVDFGILSSRPRTYGNGGFILGSQDRRCAKEIHFVVLDQHVYTVCVCILTFRLLDGARVGTFVNVEQYNT